MNVRLEERVRAVLRHDEQELAVLVLQIERTREGDCRISDVVDALLGVGGGGDLEVGKVGSTTRRARVRLDDIVHDRARQTNHAGRIEQRELLSRAGGKWKGTLDGEVELTLANAAQVALGWETEASRLLSEGDLGELACEEEKRSGRHGSFRQLMCDRRAHRSTGHHPGRHVPGRPLAMAFNVVLRGPSTLSVSTR